MIYTELTKKAMRIAFDAHYGQTDRGNTPYICHPLHVADQMPDERTTTAAILHDVLEDTELTAEDLRREGIPEDIILTDPRSFNTNENLENAQELLKGFQNINRVLIVTSDYHVPRSLAIAQDLGFEAEGYGAKCLPERWLKNHAREALAWCKYWAKKYLRLPL